MYNYFLRSIFYVLIFTQSMWSYSVYVRVLLDESYTPHWTLCCSSGFRIINKKTKKSTIIKSNLLSIKKFGNKILINNTYSCSYGILIHPCAAYDHISFNQQAYEGCFAIEHTNKGFYCINVLELERYIYSVLKSESWPGWPLEVNMALAISCRSYVVARITQRRKKKFDIYNTNKHQTYKGYHTQERLRQPVERTKGIIITHNNKPITAMFDSCCGRVVTALMEGTDFKKFPYLKRTKACDHCQPAKIFQWKAEIPIAEFEHQLRAKGFKCSKISDISVTKKDKAGIVQEVTLLMPGGPLKLPGKKLYSIFKPIKSYVYTIKKKHTTIEVQGYGYGHHLGLCQWGARYMVDKGYNHKDILKFYYPQTQLQKVA